jgi:hypothetical protein
VLAHGAAFDKGSWAPFATRLAGRGHSRCSAPTFGGERDLEVAAALRHHVFVRLKTLPVPFPNSFLGQPVGTTFYALDTAGKEERAPVYGAEYTHVFSGAWAMRVFREDEQDGPREHVNADLYFFTLVGSEFMVSRRQPEPRREHHRPTIPPGLAALHMDQSSGSTLSVLSFAISRT